MKLRRFLVITVLVLLLVTISDAQIVSRVALPADLSGEFNGVPYLIRVPANWNGILLVYAYGFAEATYPIPLAPLASDVDPLLAKGYALMGLHAAGIVTLPSLTPLAGGWNMKERIQSTAALTAAFREMVGMPRFTIVWGKSMGGLEAIALIEKFPGLYDGAVPLCAPAAGTTRSFDQKIDVRLAYAAAFGWNDQWGTPGNLRPDLDFMTEVYTPAISQQLTVGFKGKWEFLRRVSHIPDNPTSFYTGGFRLQVLWLAFLPQLDLNRRAGGEVSQNLDRIYTLSDDDRAILRNSYGLDPDPLLEQMNAAGNKVNADHNARNYAQHYVDPTGRITRPVITIHTTGDAAAIPNNEAAYRSAVEHEGKSDLLLQVYTTGMANGANTHCTFTTAQYMAGLDAMTYWLENRQSPDPATFFPPSKGFDPAYVPPDWPW